MDIQQDNYSIDDFVVDYEERRLTLEQIKRKVTKK